MKINQVWDYIIVGTGMGGGPIGLKLAQAGFSVLFLEKGVSPFESTSLKGQFAELFPDYKKNRNEVLKKAGRFNEEVYDCTHLKRKKLEPFMGSGVGGSSALYGMVLERFRRSDFKNWPFSYSEFSKYYDEAEKLFRVKSPQNFKHVDLLLLSHYLKDLGLHPYTLSLASENIKACSECQSYLCSKGCKNHSGNICIMTAVEKYGATLLAECEVQKVEVLGNQATGVKCIYSGEEVFIGAKNVVLACGALKTPLLLLNSKNADFPRGLGNQSGLVGRNLMRHFVDLFALKIDTAPQNPHVKALGFNDFGTVQSFGRLPPVNVIWDQMKRNIRNNYSPLIGFLFNLVQPVMRLMLKIVSSRRLVMASIIEDSPQFENRVWNENGKICLSYHISKTDLEKISLIRQKLKKLFKPFGTLIIQSSEKNEMLAHICGTCKMGREAETSVVDSQNKVHGMENLYVIDSSFFPTSGSTNPALTIAANSLRIAEILISRHSFRGSDVQIQY